VEKIAPLGARKSTPIVFIGIVCGDANRRPARLSLRHDGGWIRRNDLRPESHDPRQPTANSWRSKRHRGCAGLELRLPRGGERYSFGGAACTIRGFVNLLDNELMER
jgi:hypothetical protein